MLIPDYVPEWRVKQLEAEEAERRAEREAERRARAKLTSYPWMTWRDRRRCKIAARCFHADEVFWLHAAMEDYIKRHAPDVHTLEEEAARTAARPRHETDCERAIFSRERPTAEMVKRMAQLHMLTNLMLHHLD
jgi:hypothetical protein